MYGYGYRRRGFAYSVLHLVGHICGAAFLFLIVMGIAWGLGFALHYLNSIHPFPPTIHSLVESIEVALFAIDVLLSGFVVVVGAVRFGQETLGG